MAKKNDLPAMPWYWGDIFKAPDIIALPKDIRDTWLICLGRMWESDERGYMLLNGFVPDDREMAAILLFGLDIQTCNLHVKYLLDKKVFSRRASDGAIYCRRMVRDEETRKIHAECGKKGGNPFLMVNQKNTKVVNQKVNQITVNANANANADALVLSSIEKPIPKTIQNKGTPNEKPARPTAFEDSRHYDKAVFFLECPADWTAGEKEYWYGQAMQSSNKNKKYKSWILAVKNWRRDSPSQYSDWLKKQPMKAPQAKEACGYTEKDIDGVDLICTRERGHAGNHSMNRAANTTIRNGAGPEKTSAVLEHMGAAPKQGGIDGRSS